MPTLTSPQQIFISYSRRDDAVMQRIVAFLREQGFDVWVDNEQLTPGTPIWEAELEKAIKRADAVVVLLSPDSKTSPWVMRELVVAQRHQKEIFPLLVRGDEDTSLHFRLSTYQYIDLREKETLGLERLKTTVSRLFARLQRIEEEKERKETEEKKGREQKKADALAKEDAAEKARKDKDAFEKKAAEEKQSIEKREQEEALARKLAAEKVRKEKEAREKKEAEEKKRIEKRKQEEADVLAEEIAAERTRQEEAAQKKKPTNSPLPLAGEGLGMRAKPPQPKPSIKLKNLLLIIGGGIAIFACLIFAGNYIFKITSSSPEAPPTQPPATEAPTLVVPTEIPVTPTPDNKPPANAQQGDTWTRSTDDMPMAYIPAGAFQMGSEDGDDDEKPVHTVEVDAFWMDKTEVSNAQFGVFVEATGYQTEAEEKGSSYIYVDGSWESTEGADWQHSQGPDSDIINMSDHPVVHVSWNDAKAYCEWADARLPTEAEWEKAARGGLEGVAYPWGDDFYGGQANFCDVNCPLSWADENADDGYVFTASVANYPENDYGLYDTSGNVWEWASSLYKDYPYDASDGRENLEIADSRVLRGGSWINYEDYLRSAYRVGSYPADTSSGNGFRCSRSP